ncbi:MAG TPA: maleylpyruvate isomerase N-terminal domain-containing protein [Actinomycetota bacterium]|nr:maleylpyruvate isomerase N-terminal domain-containing protein [Actinomycetota bacterium]
MARREELLRAEAEGWDAFVALTDAVPPALVERPGLNAEGWTVRDLMWHVAFWCADAARALSAIGKGRLDRVREPYGDAEVSRLNDRELERSRGMRVEDVRAELHRARAAMLERFGALAALTADADEWFEESGPAHYAEHASELEAWVRANRG